MTTGVDTRALETRVKRTYELVATEPGAGFHFELGREDAVRAGYDPAVLDAVPAPAVESFAGVGYLFDLAALAPGETVVDLGSGWGMDAFCAAALTGPSDHVIGVDFTPAQPAKARRLTAESGATTLEFVDAHIEHLPLADGSADCVISNGVINLRPDKDAVFTEAARVVGNAAAARDRHRDAGASYGVRSVSVLATKPRR